MAAAICTACVAGAVALPSMAQVGAVADTPAIQGLKPGTGAPFPKGRYAALDRLPDWGGIWLLSFARPPGSGGRAKDRSQMPPQSGSLSSAA